MPVQAITTTPKRLRILGEEEIEALYGRPRFTPDERQEYFAFTPQELTTLEQFRSHPARLYGMLQSGYFKARQQFFVFTLREVDEDIRYLQERYFAPARFHAVEVSKVTRIKQQRVILALCHYRYCDATARQHLATKAQQAARVCAKPVYIFRELWHVLITQRLVAPGYTVLQELIGKTLTEEQQRLSTVVRTHLQSADIAAFQHLLDDAPGLYALTQLKHEPRDMSAGEIKREIQRGTQMAPLYTLAQRVLPALEISNESIAYYASLVNSYSVYKLKRLPVWTTYLYLLCFVVHRYQRLHDHLLTSLLSHVRQYMETAKAAAKERVYTAHTESNDTLQKAGRVLQLFTDDQIADATPFQEVRTHAFGILPRDQLTSIADHLAGTTHIDETAFQWDHIDTLAPQFKRHLRPVLLTVQFAAASARHPVLEAVHFLTTAWQKGKPLSHYAVEQFPVRCIGESLKRYLYTTDAQGHKRLRPDRYEFLVHRLLRDRLEAGDIFCRESLRFRSFEDDLLDDQQWQEKERLLAETGLPILTQPIAEHLAALEQQLEDRLAVVNQRIAAGENTHFQLTRRGRQVHWTLEYPSAHEPANHPFFEQLRQVEISSVLHFVHRQCRFLDAFEHLLGRYVKQPLDTRTLIACLLAWGTNTGLSKMGEISDISYPVLLAASENYIRLETLRTANDVVSNALAALPIFRLYDFDGHVHSSSDGQKFETRIATINARHSPKYFGLKKGVVAYSMVANHVPVNAQIIGANEHESHYVFDILFNNTTDIQPAIHSTDTHGTNEVNFALLHVFGYQFAPRYRDIQTKVREALYGFKHPTQYGDVLLKPRRKLNARLIVEEWDQMQRIFVSLARKTTTQSIIVGKLSAYARKDKTRRALWEYDNILRSLYLLDYIDSPPLRRNVQRALNRGENYHQLRRAVSYANFGKLRFKTEYDQQVWEECSRLITNCIIYYNAMILSHLFTQKTRCGDVAGAALLTQVSPVAWQHINLCGRYEFTKAPEVINIAAIIQALAQAPVPHDLAL
jgi:TnpA family transposase